MDKEQRSFRNRMSNAAGHFFENFIQGGCEYYASVGKAVIEKVPEPFRVMKKDARTQIATVQFTKKAQPDFIGTLRGGRTIVFEAKKTDTDRIKFDVLTETQRKALEEHHKMGAYAGVCVGIKEQCFFVPWEVWREMKMLYGRKYLMQADIQEYRVKYKGAIFFLDYVNKVVL